MSRILGIELRRSAAIGIALVLLVVGVLLLFFAEGIGFGAGWMQLAMTQRLYLALLWPLALAAGAWQGRREHRSGVAELFASSPRPWAQRTVPTLAAMAVAVVCGYLAMAIAGGLWIMDTAEYLPGAVFAVATVGALSLVAAVWLGLAIGRLLPSLATAPILAVAGLGALLPIPGATRPRGWLALVFSPIYGMNMAADYATVPGRASLAQAIWLVALAGTAVLLFASSGWRIRVAAVLPVVVGAALAITVMPHQSRLVFDTVDPVARKLVCAKGEPQVCLSRIHVGLLAETAAPAREGLAILAKLPGAPTKVNEDTTYYPTVYPPWDENVVLLYIQVGPDGHLDDDIDVRADVVAGAFNSPPACDKAASVAERIAAASWLIGSEPAASDTIDPEDASTAVKLWQDLRHLPPSEAQARVVALRHAALTCSVDAWRTR